MNIIDLATKSMQTAIKAVVDSIKTTTDSTKTGVDSLNIKQDTVLQKIQNGDLKRNIDIFNTPGTYSWTCPEGVNVIRLTMFGGGGSGAAIGYQVIDYAWGGFGGAYVAGKPVKVVPGTVYTIIVGKGGDGVTGTTNSLSTVGKAGGATSAFGIVCNGGSGGPATRAIPKDPKQRAFGNNPICTPGTVPSLDELYFLGSAGTTYKFSETTYGLSGIQATIVNDSSNNTTQLLGGGAGFGPGGDADAIIQSSVAHGAGSGGVARKKSANGGDGIVIIEY
ncbi:hypothetical protein R6U76_19710 [Lysinibacillus capsici]|uniref:glycine-rich domain-containing protein n=1 Tax=Lysinibacillus capsici TaxID=2115968 RepID=UPI0029DE58CB|nr:hypothetical protein [Lysinibacillus capsici]WPK04827.1 hypothetical protein R6U76_19710 [Lysinibacillus capsici]